ncbi:MAG TPA: hypothetical protein VNG33_14300 [Polyangiaceae bacterium]|nr:hypothetical protein [Polyangiaceae bacterium]
MRHLEAWLGIAGLAALACGGQSRANEQTSSAGASGVTSNGGAGATSSNTASGNNTSANDTSGATSSSGAANAGAANGGAESRGGSNVTEGGGAGVAGVTGATAGAGGSPSVPYPSVKPSVGCGTDATQATGEFVKFTIQTSGTKDANCADKLAEGTSKCGAWSYPRDYYVWLPPNYDNQHAYPLVLQAPGCGGNGMQVFSLSPTNSTAGDSGVRGSVIRIGLTPPPNEVGHATNPNQGCFDDKEGDDSVEWPFYEALIDKLKTELCYDENRVFATGNSSGGWLANELGCRYAGNTAGYAIRGVAVSRGGLPTQPAYTPTCTNEPISGIWIDEVNDATNPFVTGDKVAIARAIQVDGCMTSYETAQFQDFPIGGGLPDNTCKKILGCSETSPLVVCQLPGLSHSGNQQYVNPGFAAFIKSLEAP